MGAPLRPTRFRPGRPRPVSVVIAAVLLGVHAAGVGFAAVVGGALFWLAQPGPAVAGDDVVGIDVVGIDVVGTDVAGTDVVGTEAAQGSGWAELGTLAQFAVLAVLAVLLARAAVRLAQGSRRWWGAALVLFPVMAAVSYRGDMTSTRQHVDLVATVLVPGIGLLCLVLPPTLAYVGWRIPRRTDRRPPADQ